MNKVILIGNLVRDVEIRTSGSTTIGRYTVAVTRKFKKQGEADADFINCVVFGKLAEFAEKYFKKGTKVAVAGRIQTGSYKNKDGVTVYTTDVIVEEQEFTESRKNAANNTSTNDLPENDVNFVETTDSDDDMPF